MKIWLPYKVRDALPLFFFSLANLVMLSLNPFLPENLATSVARVIFILDWVLFLWLIHLWLILLWLILLRPNLLWPTLFWPIFLGHILVLPYFFYALMLTTLMSTLCGDGMEAIITVLTFVWPRICVDVLVILQMGQHREALGTMTEMRMVVV